MEYDVGGGGWHGLIERRSGDSLELVAILVDAAGADDEVDIEGGWRRGGEMREEKWGLRWG